MLVSWHGVGTRFVALSILVLVSAAPAGADPNCTCRANGQIYELGQILCIRGKLAQCQMNLNNTSWQTIAETCPQTKLQSERYAIASLPSRSPLSRLR
jgi:hypothetical protein